MNKLLYVNGDSYFADKSETGFSSILSSKLNALHINNAVSGSANSRIFRCVIEDLIKLKKDYDNIIAIIGLSFITRKEVWVSDTSKYTKHSWYINQVTKPAGLITADFAVKDHMNLLNSALIDLNYITTTEMVELYTKIFMLVKFLEAENIDYLIMSGANNQEYGTLNYDYLNNLELVHTVRSNKKVASIENFSIPAWAKETNNKTTTTGHLDGTTSHMAFANYLLQLIDRNS